MATRLFVTGTDTGVGKTHVSQALLLALGSQGWRSAAMKPVASGCTLQHGQWQNDDALALQAAASLQRDYVDVNPYALPEPTAPQIAARRVDCRIEMAPVLSAAQRLAVGADLLLVEGVGGWMAPLGDALMQADLARALNCQVILVVGLRLGCLNHALLSERAIRADGLPLAGWIGSALAPDFAHAADYHQLLEQQLECPWLGSLPFQTDVSQAAQALDGRRLAGVIGLA
ncbi:dethiobiotin synthase [Pseudoxanthomonas sp. CAU 1598]|uniref:ATP-dependent dethiobiotin synthetase BioD n=1 Tax=Pseudomarimonas arenosa TaxID=2774145 RepID=A0AAW3ZJ76_9GAMM|nr:dethiobiotin synthase [Pseudomarimonas arenosa]